MQLATVNYAGINISNIKKQKFGLEINLKDKQIRSFEIVTENNTYLFVRLGQTPEGFPTWYVVKGQEHLIGKEVGLLSLGKTGNAANIINRGDRLAICLNTQIKEHIGIWYTSKILNFTIIDFKY
jgi:hypothetical protein